MKTCEGKFYQNAGGIAYSGKLLTCVAKFCMFLYIDMRLRK